MSMSPETIGYRFYRLRRNPWRHTDRIVAAAATFSRTPTETQWWENPGPGVP